LQIYRKKKNLKNQFKPNLVFLQQMMVENNGTDEKRVEKVLGYAVGTGCAINCWYIDATYYYNDGGCFKVWNKYWD